MRSSERVAFRAKTTRVGILLAIVGAVLTALAVVFKLPFAGLAALVIVLGGAFWVGRRYLVVRLSRDPAPPQSH